MFRTLVRTLSLAVTVIVVASSLAMAATATSSKKSSTSTAQSATMAGRITTLDKKGLATVQIQEGKVTMQGKGWHVGDKVACDTRQGKMVCKKA